MSKPVETKLGRRMDVTNSQNVWAKCDREIPLEKVYNDFVLFLSKSQSFHFARQLMNILEQTPDDYQIVLNYCPSSPLLLAMSIRAPHEATDPRPTTEKDTVDIKDVQVQIEQRKRKSPKPHRKLKVDLATEVRAIELRKEGKSYKEVANALENEGKRKLPHGTLHAIFFRNGLIPNGNNHRKSPCVLNQDIATKLYHFISFEQQRSRSRSSIMRDILSRYGIKISATTYYRIASGKHPLITEE